MSLVTDAVVWLYHWQTLLGAALALFGAWLTVRKIREQIDQSDRHERERLARQHNAPRATLPLTLSGITTALRDLIIELDRCKTILSKSQHVEDFSAPPPPSEYISDLKDVIATTEDRSVTEPIAELIREIQTLWARIETLASRSDQVRRASLVENVNDWMIQTATTYALAEALFDYSRAETPEGPTSVKVAQAQSLIFRHHLEDAQLVKRIERLITKSENSWTLN